MKSKKLTELETAKLANIIEEKIESEVFIINDNNYVYFKSYDEQRAFSIGYNRLCHIAVSNKKEKSEDFIYLLNILSSFK